MLRKIRITLATVMFIGITLLFLDFTGTMHHWVSWMPKIQSSDGWARKPRRTATRIRNRSTPCASFSL